MVATPYLTLITKLSSACPFIIPMAGTMTQSEYKRI
jgi:hypothetical protein